MATADNVGSQQTEYQQRIRAALLEGYEGFTTLWEGGYAALAGLVGMRVKAPLTLRQLSVAVGALAEGCSLRQHVDPHLGMILRPTGPNGENQEWTLFAIGLEGLLNAFPRTRPGLVAAVGHASGVDPTRSGSRVETTDTAQGSRPEYGCRRRRSSL